MKPGGADALLFDLGGRRAGLRVAGRACDIGCGRRKRARSDGIMMSDETYRVLRLTRINYLCLPACRAAARCS